MRSWIFYKMHANDHHEFINCIQKNAEQINPPTNQNHHYYNVEYIVHFSKGIFGSKRKVIYETERSKKTKDAFWHSLITEKDFVECVKQNRKTFLFKHDMRADLHEAIIQFVNELSDAYDKVSNFDEELNLLKACTNMDWQKYFVKNNLPFSELIIQNVEKQWETFIKSWFGHTTNESFPFMKRTFNLYKAFGFDLGGDKNKKKLYAVVQFFC